jgi:hypothetical protein
MLGLAGVIAMDTSVAEVTVIVVEPDMFPHFAVIFAWPVPVAFVCPGLRNELDLSVVDEENPESCATSVPDAIFKASTADEDHVTVDVRSFVVLSE